MKNKSTIQQLLACFLLLLFLSNSLPRNYWHAWLSKHGDTCLVQKSANDDQVGSTQQSCDGACEYSVIPFVNSFAPFTFKTVHPHRVFYHTAYASPDAVATTFFSLRAPPAL